MITYNEQAELVMKDFHDFIKRWNLDCQVSEGKVCIGWNAMYDKLSSEMTLEAGEFLFEDMDRVGIDGLEIRT